MAKQENPTLRDLLAAPVTKSVSGIDIVIKPLGWYDSVEVIEAIVPALESMPTPPTSGGELPPEESGHWLTWASVHRDDVVQFCHLATGQDEDIVKGLPPLALLDLVFVILEVNADFFVQSLPGLAVRMGPRIDALVNKVVAAMEAFMTTSSASLRTATASAS